MSVAKLNTLEKTNHGSFSAADVANKIIKAVNDGGGVSSAEKTKLAGMLAKDKFSPAAKTALQTFLNGLTGGGAAPPAPRVVAAATATGNVATTSLGSNAASFDDDSVTLGKDGDLTIDTGIEPWTRSYDSIQEGPLRKANGSPAPASTILSASALDALHKETPGAALDAAAKVFGVTVGGFQAMATSKEFYDTSAQSWEGKCHAWTWSSLSTTIDKLVDVDGPDGQKGLWIGGQWLSRADLGNWMMAVADQIAVSGNDTLFDNKMNAADLLKGTLEYMAKNGGGVIADVWNDAAHDNDHQIWNQPFIKADVTTSTVAGAAAASVLAQAKKDGVSGAVVRLANIVGTYGVEASDDYEGAPNLTTKNWNMYVVTDASGKMLTAYMANDKKLASVTGLPTATTDDVPDYFWKPNLAAINDTLAGKSNPIVNADSHGREFTFFVQDVLEKGVSGVIRQEFEAAIKALPAGAISAAKVSELKRTYSTIANAYAPSEWQSSFGSRGLGAKDFGASWPIPSGS